MSAAARAPLTALAASIGLIAIYLAFGGSSYEPAGVEDPCASRDPELVQQRGVFEAIALSSLDGAACELQVSREELTLALASEDATADFAEARGIEPEDVEAAVRAGLVRAVDDQAAAGQIDDLEESVLREVAERAPVGAAIEALQALSGEDSIQGLLQGLGEFGEFDLPRLEELPNLDDIPTPEELDDLLP